MNNIREMLMKKKATTIALILIFIVGISVMLYPVVSNYINSKNESKAVAGYKEKVSQMDSEKINEMFAQAQEYNEKVYKNPMAFFDPTLVEGYNSIMDVTGTGIMGYVSIPKINVELPVYHGTSEGVLAVAAGHLEGTSFPVGMENTHAVISAHRGLPSARLFTDADKIEIGDSFTVTILDRVFTYEVDQILTVKPEEVGALQIEEGKDYCTIMTCTPYGVNSHRLLVRGVHMETGEKKEKITAVTSDARLMDNRLVALMAAFPILIIIFVITSAIDRKKRKELKQINEKADIKKS